MSPSEMTAWYVGLRNYILSSPKFAALHTLYLGMPAEAADFFGHRENHLRAASIVRATLDPNTLAVAAQAIDEYVRQDLATPPLPDDDSPEALAVIETLSDLGHAALPMIDAGRAADMKAYFDDQPVDPRKGGADGETCTVEEARKGKFANHSIEASFGCPHLAELANDPRTLAIVQRYLGTVPTIFGYYAKWSFADGEEARDEQLFHIDTDDYRFCKMFIYLTDVTEETGPHAFIEGSHDTDRVSEVRSDWPGGVAEFDKWFFAFLRKTDAQTRRVFGKDPALLTGPAGTAFLADTGGVHKGMQPVTGERLICQVLYGVSPMVQDRFECLEMGTPATRHLPGWLVEPPNRYVNRLFVRPAKAPA